MSQIINIVQLALSILLVTFVLLQQRGTGLGGAFGGGGGEFYSTRRGFEKILFYATIGTAALFIIISVISLTIH